jgi:hypothetical protein
MSDASVIVVCLTALIGLGLWLIWRPRQGPR